ncbi:MAG: hypothetical protein ACOYZ7_17280 [Chloroflexota bacterium]
MAAEPSAQDTLNPYITNRPVDDPARFSGRADLLAWVRERLVRSDRVLLLHGVRRIGKTSFLLQLLHHVPAGYLPVRLDLQKLAHEFNSADQEPAAGSQQASFMWALCRDLAQQLGRLHALNLASPQRAEFARDATYAWREFFTDLRQVLGNNVLLLLLDDLDALPANGPQRQIVLDVVDEALERRPGLRFVIAAQSLDWLLAARGWAQNAPLQHIGPLNSTEAHDLLKSPVAGRLTYDPAAARRIVELASGQPYYLQLLGYTLFNRRFPGEVSLPDVSAALEELLPLPFDEFEAWWAASSPSEQAVLALFGELKGQGGVFTFYEIQKALSRRGVRVKRSLLEQALQSLVERGILEHLGAISYRARIELFRAWLPFHSDLLKAAKKAHWRVQRRPTPTSTQELAAELTTGNWPAVAIATATVLVLVVLLFRLPPAAKPRPTLTATVADTRSASPIVTASARPSRPPLTPTDPAVATAQVETGEAQPSPTTEPENTPPGLSVEGQILYMRKENADDPWQLYLMQADGADPRPLTASALGEAYPAWGASGRSVAFVSERDGNKEIYIMRLDGVGLTNLTRHPADDWTPSWSPDGQWIAFASFRDENWELYAVRADGTELLRLTENEVSDLSPVWSPDGKTLAFASKRHGDWEIYVMPWQGTATTRLTDSPGSVLSPSWSPDGQWIAFESTRDGDAEIYLMRTDGSEPRNLSRWPYADDHGPVWSPDGRWIAFYSNRDGDWDIYLVDTEGKNLTNLTDNEANDQSPVWGP